MKLRLSILLLAAVLAAAPAAGQTVKSLGFNTTNGQVVYSGTNPLTFTNSLQFSTNARAATRTNLGATTVGDSVFTATNEAAAATAIGLGATNNVQFESVTYGSNQINFANAELFGPWAFDEAIGFFGDQQVAAETRTNLGLGATNSVTFNDVTAQIVDAGEFRSSAYNFELFFEGGNGLAQNGNNIFTWTSTNASFAVPVTFSTNVTVNGNLSVGSFTTTTPSTWALDATQTAAATNGVLDLPSNANVLRITNANTISGVSNGVLGAFYFLVNESGTDVVISNSATITARGATNITLGANESATLISTTATNASAH